MLNKTPFEMMADPLFTPDLNISIKEEPRTEAALGKLPEIQIKNEPLSPPPAQEYHEVTYDPQLTPKAEEDHNAVTPPQTTFQPHQDVASHSSNNSTTTTSAATASATNTRTHAVGHSSSTEFRHQTMFVDAVQNGDYSEVERLLDFGDVNLNRFDTDGQTALHRVCCEGRLELVKLLVRFGADVRLCNRDGWSALHLACWGGHQDIVMYILSALKTNAH